LSLFSRIRDERGVAIAVVMGVMLVLGILSTVIASQAMQQSRGSDKNRSGKRALEAASAGVQQARYRLNTSAPADTACMVSSGTTGSVGAPCIVTPESIGNGATYQYYMSPVLTPGSTCGAAPTIGNYTRCLTVIGTVRNETRRLQTAVTRVSGTVIFDLTGVVGLTSVTLSNSATSNTDVGSNGSVTVTNSAQVQGKAYTPSLSVTNGGVVTGGQTIPTKPFVLPPADFSSANAPRTPNANVSAGSAINSNRVLSVAGSTIVTLGSGVYDVCGISLANSAQLRIAAGAKVQIYVDSPARTGSNCTTGTGTVDLGQGTFTNVSAGDPTKLEVYVYGTNASPNSDVQIRNAAQFRGTIYAPRSTISTENNTAINGALAGDKVIIEQSSALTFPAGLRTQELAVPGRYQINGWTECRPTGYSPGNIASNC
jgi:Tfp pilus assembly protein PilX